jgi:hypothetical protein
MGFWPIEHARSYHVHGEDHLQGKQGTFQIHFEPISPLLFMFLLPVSANSSFSHATSLGPRNCVLHLLFATLQSRAEYRRRTMYQLWRASPYRHIWRARPIYLRLSSIGMAEIVNLRTARKRAERSKAERRAAENRQAYGASKRARADAAAEQDKLRQMLDGHRIEPGDRR